MSDWKSPASEEAKRQAIGKDWETVVDTYLWFWLGTDIDQLSTEEIAAIVTEFFIGEPGFGDVELHDSGNLPGHHLLRLRGKLRLKPSVTIRDRYCPLFQMGHDGGGVLKNSDDMVNFCETMPGDAE